MSTPPRPLPAHPDVIVLDHVQSYAGYWRIERVRCRLRRFDGALSPPLVREVFERGHAVAVLPYDPVQDRVVLVEQLRLPALMAGLDPWLVETPAGIIEAGEAPEDVARRELQEEAGLEALALEPIARYLPSPGGCSETIALFAARVAAPVAGADGIAGLAGLAEEHEDIRVHAVPSATALDWLAAGRIRNGTTIIALQWLALNRAGLRQRWR